MKMKETVGQFNWSQAMLDQASCQFSDECVICSSDDYTLDNLRLQCKECDNSVHQDCVGEKSQNLRHDMNADQQLEVTWICQVCYL